MARYLPCCDVASTYQCNVLVHDMHMLHGTSTWHAHVAWGGEGRGGGYFDMLHDTAGKTRNKL